MLGSPGKFVLYFIKETANLFSGVAAPCCISTSKEGAEFSTVSPTPGIISLSKLGVVGVMVYFVVVLIYLSLLTNDTEQPLMCLFSIYRSSLVKGLFKPFATFSWLSSYI